jgi:hypothetical protein
MPVYVYHMGRIVEKSARPIPINTAASDLAAPAVQSFTTYASPINDATISSHRQRDRDLHASGSYDPRDTPAEFRKAQDGRRKSNQRSAVTLAS